jgi:hypothetical protein
VTAALLALAVITIGLLWLAALTGQLALACIASLPAMLVGVIYGMSVR